MKTINVLSWGGGTQSTALLLMILKKEIDIKLDYIIFADTGNENTLLYKQIDYVRNYIKKHYDRDIIITSKMKQHLTVDQAVDIVGSGIPYRNSIYDDIYTSHVLYFKGLIKSINVMPLYIRHENGNIAKTKFKTCSKAYKIDEIMRYIREKEHLKRIKNQLHINMIIGFSYDEIMRLKPNPLSYATNIFPLVDLMMTKDQCRDYVKKTLGFTPISSVCNMCYANDFNKVYNIWKYTPKDFEKLVYLDSVMNDKPINHPIKNDVFMFKFQAVKNIRLKDIDFETMRNDWLKDDTFIREQEMACMGGCFL